MQRQTRRLTPPLTSPAPPPNDREGGAIFLDTMGNCDITSTTFTKNWAVSFLSSNSYMNQASGGAVYQYYTNCRYNRTNFIANKAHQSLGSSASAGLGGAMYIYDQTASTQW